MTHTTSTAPAIFAHRHEASHAHGISSGWANPSARYGTTIGTCRCGERVTQLVEAGMTAVTNWHPFRTDAELAEIDAAHGGAIAEDAERAAAKRKPGAGVLIVRYGDQHGVDMFDVDRPESMSRLRRLFEDAAHGADVPVICNVWHLGPDDAEPVPVRSAHERDRWDSDDYCDATVHFVTVGVTGRIVATIGYRIDGRA